MVYRGKSRVLPVVFSFLLIAATGPRLLAQSTPASTSARVAAKDSIRVAEIQGVVEVLALGGTTWQVVQTNLVLYPLDQLRTAANSRLALRWSDQSIVSFGAFTKLEILPPDRAGDQAGLHLIRGVISFFHRDKPGHIRLVTAGAVAGVEGTEFVLAVNDADATTLSVIDGKVRFGNDQATLLLTNGDQAVAAPGTTPQRTAGFIANNLLQWCFYYPAVIDPDELQLTDGEQKDFADSLAAYRSGDLLAALALYPSGRSGISGGETVYHAALLLAVGEVEPAEQTLSTVADQSGPPKKLGDALRQLIAAVKRQPAATGGKPELASELMAGSYFEQSHPVRETSLRNALQLARLATVKSPKFGFAWERVAELEFSFGETKNALPDLERSLELSPRNAQALALKGFILAAQNQPKLARVWFDRAIAVDAALGNAWLGRGLTRIHQGDKAGGREDLLMAAALEPQRAELRSYLGKAYAHSGDDAHATKELALAKKLDPNDPTAWLYSALLNQQDNQINDAIRDLEKSESLNDNRSVYRSQLLLDEDSAVRSANLAGMYQDAGMFNLSVREAGRAVSSDYANYSAHLFLASSYDQMRSPNWSNLRYETPATSEFWIANLLAPTSAGWQSAIASEKPYANLFDQNRVGVVSDTTYLGRGAFYQEGAQFGTYDNFSYNLDATYVSDPGQRPNNDFENRDVNLSLKYQFTPQDSAFFNIEQAQINYGDENEYYNQANASSSFRLDETQQPNLYLGYHHEWSPGVHTLFLASRQVGNEFAVATNAAQYIAFYSGGNFVTENILTVGEHVTIDPEVNSTELQQIWETPNHTTIIGTRFEWGDVHFQNYEWDSGDLTGNDMSDFPVTYPVIAQQDFRANFHHYNAYGYHTWQIADPLSLTAGLTYDWLHEPADVATAPFADQEKTTIQFSPKAGFVWQPAGQTVVRGAYTRSLSGFINGQSTRLEPTEVAGFNQAFRSFVPESVAGDSSGSKFDTFDLSFEQKFDTGTYLSLAGEVLYSKLNDLQGGFVFYSDSPLNQPVYPLGFNQSENYHEESMVFTLDQLLGKQWSVGAVYSLSEAKLDLNYVNFNTPGFVVQDPSFQVSQGLRSVLSTVNLHANWNHPSGLFSVLEANWYRQSNSGFSPPPGEPGDDFWQFNAYLGYRALHRRMEFTVGLLNIFDQNYQLEPLNLYNEMARGRTFLARLRISF
jgi:Tfp pilus assembly protein PilF